MTYKYIYVYRENKEVDSDYKTRFEEKLGKKDKFSGKLKYYKKKISKEKDKVLKMGNWNKMCIRVVGNRIQS